MGILLPVEELSKRYVRSLLLYTIGMFGVSEKSQITFSSDYFQFSDGKSGISIKSELDLRSLFSASSHSVLTLDSSSVMLLVSKFHNQVMTS